MDYMSMLSDSISEADARLAQQAQAFEAAQTTTTTANENSISNPDEVIEEYMQLYRSISQECETWHNYILGCRKLAFLKHYDTDEMFDVTVSKPHSVVTYASGVLSSSRLKIQAYQFKETEPSIVRSSNYERFVSAVWDLNSEEQKHDLKRTAITDMLIDGSAWAYVYIDPAKLPQQYTVASWSKLPVTIELVDSTKIFPRLSRDPGRMFDYIFRVERVDMWNLVRKYPDQDWEGEYGTMTENEQRDTLIDVYHYNGYDLEGNVVYAVFTERMLFVDEVMWNSAQFDLPWAVAACVSFRAIDNTKMGLTEYFQSFLHPIIDSTMTVEHILSTNLRALDMYGNMPPVTWTEGGRDVQVTGRWGDHVELRQGEQIGFPTWPGNPPDAQRLIAFMMSDIQESSFSAAAMGMAGSSASGYSVAINTETSRSKLQIPSQAWSEMVKQVALLSAHLIETYLPNVTISMYERNLDGALLPFGFNSQDAYGMKLDVKCMLKMPGDDVKLAAQAAQLKATGLVSNRYLQEEVLGVDQPDNEESRIAEERVRTHPLAILMDLAQKAAERQSPFLPVILQALQKETANSLSGSGGATMAPSAPGAQNSPMAAFNGINPAAAPDEMLGAPPLQPGGPTTPEIAGPAMI